MRYTNDPFPIPYIAPEPFNSLQPITPVLPGVGSSEAIRAEAARAETAKLMARISPPPVLPVFNATAIEAERAATAKLIARTALPSLAIATPNILAEKAYTGRESWRNINDPLSLPIYTIPPPIPIVAPEPLNFFSPTVPVLPRPVSPHVSGARGGIVPFPESMLSSLAATAFPSYGKTWLDDFPITSISNVTKTKPSKPKQDKPASSLYASVRSEPWICDYPSVCRSSFGDTSPAIYPYSFSSTKSNKSDQLTEYLAKFKTSNVTAKEMATTLRTLAKLSPKIMDYP